MKKRNKVKYKNEPIGEVKLISDFLPPPEELVKKEESVKITLLVSKSSVEFFREVAKQQHSQYQKMIRNLLDQYVAHFSDDSNFSHEKKKSLKKLA